MGWYRERSAAERRQDAAIRVVVEERRYLLNRGLFRTREVDLLLLQWLEIEADLMAGRPPRHEL